MLLNQLVWFKSIWSWFDDFLKLKSFGFDAYVFPSKYGKTGFLYPLKIPEDSGIVLKVAKYAYVPLGKSGVLQNSKKFQAMPVIIIS